MFHFYNWSENARLSKSLSLIILALSCDLRTASWPRLGGDRLTAGAFLAASQASEHLQGSQHARGFTFSLTECVLYRIFWWKRRKGWK